MFKVVILSANPDNAKRCVYSILSKEPHIEPAQIVIVDDGAKHEAEKYLRGITWIQGAKPFVFSRNANIGLAAAHCDAFLMNDDAVLESHYGFTNALACANEISNLGLLSPGVIGPVCNRNQEWTTKNELRQENRMLAFICILVKATVYAKIGPLDERFVGYGMEDNDYCERARRIGLSMWVWDGCKVRHEPERGTYSKRAEIKALFEQNKVLFKQKWASKGM